MIGMQGQGVSRGIAAGPVHFIRSRTGDIEKRKGSGVQAELDRLDRAFKAASRQMQELAEQCRRENRQEAADLLETHALLMEDEDYLGRIRELIRSEECAAEYAVHAAGEEFAAQLEQMDDGYMKARAVDIRDVSGRLTDSMNGTESGTIEINTPVVLAADDLTPSQTIQLDSRTILGFATKNGSVSSHTAILARAMGIPAVCGLGDDLSEKHDGKYICLDGETGQLIIDPDEETLSKFRKKAHEQAETRRELEELIGQKDITADGREIMLYCNIASPDDIAAVHQNDGQGIGLYRSEFLFMNERDLPGEERQFEAYRAAAEAMKGKRVIIRTMDIGADKQAGNFHLKKEENPALGMRAIRISLTRPEIFRQQLRALYRASAYGKISIMFPMISSLWEMRECRRMCREAADELERAGIPCDREMEIGVMIETPAAVLIADELAREADFFSVGTNDLTQYLLACDRQNGDLNRFYDPHHPSVLRAIRMAADAAHAAGIWIGVCGELAGEPEMIHRLLDIGVDELSVAPSMVLPVRRGIRRFTGKH